MAGAHGKMGSRVSELARRDPRFRLVAGVVKGQASQLPGHLKGADVLIDFTEPRAALRFTRMAAAARRAVVIGTTGFTAGQTAELKRLSRAMPVLLAPNLSPGMNLLYALAGQAAGRLKDYDASIVDVHHKHKKDAPSGSALGIAQAVRAARGGDSSVPIASLRAGTVVGEHTLMLAGPYERLEITHRVSSRDVFARGALEAALWLSRQKPGWHDAREWLGMKSP